MLTSRVKKSPLISVVKKVWQRKTNAWNWLSQNLGLSVVRKIDHSVTICLLSYPTDTIIVDGKEAGSLLKFLY